LPPLPLPPAPRPERCLPPPPRRGPSQQVTKGTGGGSQGQGVVCGARAAPSVHRVASTVQQLINRGDFLCPSPNHSTFYAALRAARSEDKGLSFPQKHPLIEFTATTEPTWQ